MNEKSDPASAPRRKGLRSRHYILIFIVVLTLGLAATQIFLNQTHVASPRFIPMTFFLYTATTLVVVALLILAAILGRNLVKLYFERKSGQAGSGFKTKMVRIFIVLSLLPAVLLFLLAYGLISSQIEQWFQAPLAEIMEHSRLLAERYYQEAEQRGKYFAAGIAGYVQATDGLRGNRRSEMGLKLLEFRRQYDIDNVQIFNRDLDLVAETGNSVAGEAHRDSVMKLVGLALEGQSGFHVARLYPRDPFTEISWAAASIREERGGVIGVVLTETVNAQSAGFRAGEVRRAYEKYEQLQQERNALRYNTLLILFLSTLLIVFAFSWFALYLAKRITGPIQALAEGAEAVAAGNLEYRVRSRAFDELAGLIASFNQMTGDLEEKEKRIEAAQQSLRRTNIELDDRRRYIETILQTIATGVLALDRDYRIRTINRAAMRMLEVPEGSGEGFLEEVIPSQAHEIIRELLEKSEVPRKVVRNIHLNLSGKSLQLAAIVTPLADSEGQGTGWVVVLDDMTELLRMEKLIAWREVARRLAHEIKNPLTPIQLSAERILRRYKQMGPPPENNPEAWDEAFSKFDGLLEECTRTIIQEAGSLKDLVDEFSRFARLPEVRLEEADVHSVLDNALGLYGGRIRDVDVRKYYDPGIPRLQLDPVQMKRVFINLFDNALEAMAGNAGAKILEIRTCLDAEKNSACIEIGDTGQGFPEEYQGSLFLPYFSARKGGTGLGLAIVRQIVSDHRGKVRAEKNKPAGTKIIIDLPLASA
ncbi:MAG: HAMP domain-containing protein [Acidobacteria bacterium]|nr:HAMP domain-containing protein [Acidobacteriota bacterium]